MTDNPTTLDIVSGSNYLAEEESTARQKKTRLATPVAILWLATLLVAPSQLLLWWLFDTNSGYFAVTGLLFAASVALSLLLPVIDRHERREQNFAVGRAGEEQLATFLRSHLDKEWSLYRNLLLPDGKGDIDAVLLGPGGLFVLEVKAWNGDYRVTGTRWQKRTPSGGWWAVDSSPSGQALANARRLEAWLNAQGVCLTAHPRIVWAGPGSVQFVKSSVSVWLLAKPAYIHRDLKPSDSLSPESRRQIARTLTRLVG
ncbi:MAG: NERD domain-containing protein [Caldilineaceae bacterium]|nr:NERD domain-containing protein [Caldilineaceae bacterium]HRJ41854.1 nuclease-related domain-containing protein [Caldilineaceae bacterium]